MEIVQWKPLRNSGAENKAPPKVPPPKDSEPCHQKERDSGFIITKKVLKDHCRKNDLYMTPRLNEVLYLHHKGFTKISNLEEYTALKTLWLENNCISDIENISHLKDLRCLYLHSNRIVAISNLDGLTMLTTLNLAGNFIEKIEGLSTLVKLHTLVLTDNKLKTAADVEHLKECQSISVLELSRNGLGGPKSGEGDGVLDVLSSMSNLKVLTLMGNPLVRETSDYRRTVLSRCGELTYLDQRPVGEKERGANDAWKSGGLEAERTFKEEWNRREQQKIYNGVVALMSVSRQKYLKKGDLPRMRDKNLEKRGIDPSSMEDQLAAVEERGRELMAKYREELGGGGGGGEQAGGEGGEQQQRSKEDIVEDSKSCLDSVERSVALLAESERRLVESEGARHALMLRREMGGGEGGEWVAATGALAGDVVEVQGEEMSPRSDVGSDMVKVGEDMQIEEEEGRGEVVGATGQAVDLDRVFTIPQRLCPQLEKESNMEVKLRAAPEKNTDNEDDQDENSRLMYQLGALAGNFGYMDFEAAASKKDDIPSEEEGEKLSKRDFRKDSAKVEEDEVASDMARRLKSPRREYLEVPGEESDGDCPERRRTELIGIGREIGKLFSASRSPSPNIVTSGRMSVVSPEKGAMRTNEAAEDKKRILIEELD